MPLSANSARGFTLVEILMSLFIAAVVFGTIYAFFATQSRTYVSHSQDIELQQGLRVSLRQMQRELLMVGYNPGLEKDTVYSDGVDNNCNSATDEVDDASTLLVDESEAIGFVIAGPDTVAFTLDRDGDGITCSDREQVTYTLSGSTLLRNGQPRLENVDALDFVYLDKTDNLASSVAEIRSVQVSIIARVKNENPSYTDTKSYLNLQGVEILAPQNDSYRRRMLTTRVFCRNLGLLKGS